MTTIAFVDTETTGLDPERHDMWELAMRVFDLNEDGGLGTRVEDIHIFVKPDMWLADPTALRMNKFYQRTNDPSFEWSADESAAAAFVASLLGTDNCHVAGMNVPFDMAMIAKWLRRNDQVAAWHYHPIELESMMAAVLASSGHPVGIPWKSDNLSKALGVEPPTKEQRHTAVGDMEWCERVYAHIFGTSVDPGLVNGGGEQIPDWATS